MVRISGFGELVSDSQSDGMRYAFDPSTGVMEMEGSVVILFTLQEKSHYTVLSGDCITSPSMVKCTSVGEIEEEDGTITVAHPSFVVMTAYFMGLDRYTIIMGKACMPPIFCFPLAFVFFKIGLGLAELGRSGNQNSSSVCYGLRALSVKLDEQDQCHRGVMARLVRYRTPYEMDPFSCLQALDRVPRKDVFRLSSPQSAPKCRS
ncbi:hypothetical protein DY000_02032095 [Brassica cretica]|uniref:Uncharacterized protein n=1 Tax=Brassica cretica TaxID=69181 RepID=A0ABQ7DDR3_BRACR|nr:hypothetical protein DY000_02032095 [Brassica cretica]